MTQNSYCALLYLEAEVSHPLDQPRPGVGEHEALDGSGHEKPEPYIPELKGGQLGFAAGGLDVRL